MTDGDGSSPSLHAMMDWTRPHPSSGPATRRCRTPLPHAAAARPRLVIYQRLFLQGQEEIEGVDRIDVLS